MASVTAQAATLKIKVGAGALTKISGFKNFDGLQSGSAAQIDVSDLDSVMKEFRIGLGDEGEVKFSHNWLPTDPGQVIVTSARSNQALCGFELALPDAAKKFTFNGYVTTAPVGGGLDKVTEFDFTVKVTGAISLAAISN